jgi:hypothetical protein
VPVQPLLADEREDLPLGAEGRVDGAHGDPGLGGDRLDAGRAVAGDAEQAPGRLGDALTGRRRLCLPVGRPGLSFTIEDSVERGDTIWVRVRARGTATGPFFGPPSGRPVDITVADIAHVVDGGIVEHGGVPDRFALLAQTGILNRLT